MPAVDPEIAGAAYLEAARPALARALSRLDAESTSPSHGSFDRTWWCWKFVDFSASRFQEGALTLAWLATSPLAPARLRDNPRIVGLAAAAIGFWSKLQHADGSFDEAYPFERSLAATAFGAFYVGQALERLAGRLPPEIERAGRTAVAGAARWLASNGEGHGVLSNHLAAAAAALQVAGDLLGTKEFESARDKHLATIYAHQDPDEGWLREYGGADPGYQSHGLFYLAAIQRRTGDARLLASIERALAFQAWFVHPDASVGGEYASRGTKFAFPAGFEMLAGVSSKAAAIAVHLRARAAEGRGIGPATSDAWNLFPLLNNYLLAAEAAVPLPDAPALPWHAPGASVEFARAGLVVARRGDRLIVVGAGLGGALKIWRCSDGALVYEDCGYAARARARVFVSQTPCEFASATDAGGTLTLDVDAPFRAIPAARFSPEKFVLFRIFTLTIGRAPALARWIKDLLVATLIRKRAPHPARLRRRIDIAIDGRTTILDDATGVDGPLEALARHVPIHMGSSRYVDLEDAAGALVDCPAPEPVAGGARRRVEIAP